MQIVVMLLGILVAAIGGLGIVYPAALMRFVATWQSPPRLYVAALMRLLFGIVLIVAAPSCRASGIVRAIGILAVIAVIVFFLLGTERSRSIIRWWSNRSTWFTRLWAAIAMGFGVFLIYAGS
jgi:hypothetical protein